MNTPTHFLMTAALRKALPRLQMSRSAVLWGSIAPDIPLYFLSIGGLIYYRYAQAWPLSDAAKHIFDNLYFHDPVWIALHNLLHSPLSLAALLLLSSVIRNEGWRQWSRWFIAACLLHSVDDIFTHYDDGPLLLWPLDWHWRFHSPVSYWDHRHFGSEASRFEFVFIIALCVYLIGPWLYRRVRGPRPEDLG